MDVDRRRRYGEDWLEATISNVTGSDVVIALIGRDWLTASDDRGRRLDQPDDTVRVEIETALERQIRLIPAVVEGADMPRGHELPDSLAPLARREAAPLSHIRWEFDIGQLTDALKEIREEKERERVEDEECERVEREARERAEQARLENEQRERADRQAAEQRSRDQAEKEAAEREAAEKVEREREAAAREAAEKVEREREAAAREAAAKVEREREAAAREAAAKAAREQEAAAHEAAEKVERERQIAERVRIEKEKAEREALERAKRERRLQRQQARRARRARQHVAITRLAGSRKAQVISGVGIATVGAAVGIFVVLTRPPAFPTAQERPLVAMIPHDPSQPCKRSRREKNAVATVTCPASLNGGGEADIFSSRFRSNQDTDNWFEQKNAELRTRRDCQVKGLPGRWSDLSAGTLYSDEAGAGRIRCEEHGSQGIVSIAVILWTDARHNVGGEAQFLSFELTSRQAEQRLYNNWRCCLRVK